MTSIVVYASHFGNTRKIAEAIAAGLRSCGPAQVYAAEEAPNRLPMRTTFVVIGGPTEQHGMTEPLTRFFARLEPSTLNGVAAAAFDTRLRWPRWLSGSAATTIATRLREAGAELIAPEESFYIKGIAGTGGRNTAELAAGEVERAQAWAAALAASVVSRSAATPGVSQ